MDAGSNLSRWLARNIGRGTAVRYHRTVLHAYPAPVVFATTAVSSRVRNALAAYRPGWPPGELCRIMKSYGSDKGNGWHNYSIFYEALLKDLRVSVCNIFELGIGTTNLSLKSNMRRRGHPGASLRGWRSFLPKAHVYAADIDRDILDQGEGISCFYCDQTSQEAVSALWSNPALAGIAFDLIVDDGLHEFEANRNFLEHSIHKLKRDGIFIVEDILEADLNAWRSYIAKNTLAGGKCRMSLIEIPHEYNSIDNNILCVEYAE